MVQDKTFMIISDEDTLTISITARDKATYDTWLQTVRKQADGMEVDEVDEVEKETEKQKTLWAAKQKISERVVDIFERADLTLKIWEKDNEQRIYLNAPDDTITTFYTTGNSRKMPGKIDIAPDYIREYNPKKAQICELMQDVAREWKHLEVRCNMMTDEQKVFLDAKEQARIVSLIAAQRKKTAAIKTGARTMTVLKVVQSPHQGHCIFICISDYQGQRKCYDITKYNVMNAYQGKEITSFADGQQYEQLLLGGETPMRIGDVYDQYRLLTQPEKS